VKQADGVLDITYTYPSAKGLSPALSRRWSRFLAGVKKHEEVHGDIARQMARAVEKSIVGLSVPNDRGCRKARAETKRRMEAVYADYEARQIRFDTREHRGKGPVERLIDGLIEN
jgi:predicted secreted Zn-dependent protease